MSIECSECEHDLRGGHAPGCSRDKKCPKCGQMMSVHIYDDEEEPAKCPKPSPEPPPAEPPTHLVKNRNVEGGKEFWDHVEKVAKEVRDREAGSRPSAPAPLGEPPCDPCPTCGFDRSQNSVGHVCDVKLTVFNESSPVDLRDAARKWLHSEKVKSLAFVNLGRLPREEYEVEILAAFAAAAREGK